MTQQHHHQQHHHQERLERPERLAELNPGKTLEKIGVGKNDVICDLGAGTGIFTIPAAQMTDNTVYALDINDEFLGIIEEKAKQAGLPNIKTIKVSDFHYDLETAVVDLVLLVVVLHEIPEKESLLKEIKRVIKPGGKLAILEFLKEDTPLGPPVSERLEREEIMAVCAGAGFSKHQEFVLGDNIYGIVFTC